MLVVMYSKVDVGPKEQDALMEHSNVPVIQVAQHNVTTSKALMEP